MQTLSYSTVAYMTWSCWSGRLHVVSAGARASDARPGGRSWQTTECWRSSQRNEDAAAPVGETSTLLPAGGRAENMKKFFGGSAEVLLGR